MKRIFPPLEPRRASYFCWRTVQTKIQYLVNNIEPMQLCVRRLDEIRGLLMRKDEDFAARVPPGSRNRRRSDGALEATAMLFGSQYNQELLQVFKAHLLRG